MNIDTLIIKILKKGAITINTLSPIKLGDRIAKLPIIQGAMGVGVSLSSLASAVACEGAIGVISGVQIGYDEPDFLTNNAEANIRALKKHIKRAKEICSDGIIGVNLLTAMKNYKKMVVTAVEMKIDLIISGAGLPLDLPALVANSQTKIAPIVSSGKAATLISKVWDKKYKRIPDMIIVEGSEAGGHLGFSKEELEKSEFKNLEELVPEVIEAIKPFEEKYNQKIPVIAAGGVYSGEDIAKFIKLGAGGVQMATRFVATKECDAHINFKNSYVNAKKEDIRLVQSPVGMPGRAVDNEFTKKLDKGNIPVKHCYNCLVPCNPATTPYCISQALIQSVKGDMENGLVFAGSNAYKIDKITTVKDLIKELCEEACKYL